MDEEDVKCRCADDRLNQDFEGREPVKLRTPVQKHLHGGNRDAQAAKSEPVKLRCGAGLRLPQKDRYATECEHSQGHVDIEYPSPAVVVGQPAADHRPQHWPHHHRYAEYGHRGPAFFHRIDVEQNRLAKRNKCCAEESLQQSEGHDLDQRLRKAAQHGCDHEADHGHHQDALAAELVCKEARWRGHDGRGHDIGGQHPVDLIRARRHAALHVGKRDICNRRIQCLHDNGEDDTQRNRGAVDRLGICRVISHVQLPDPKRSVMKLGNPRACPVSTFTSTLIPTRSGGLPGALLTRIRIGIR